MNDDEFNSLLPWVRNLFEAEDEYMIHCTTPGSAYKEIYWELRRKYLGQRDLLNMKRREVFDKSRGTR